MSDTSASAITPDDQDTIQPLPFTVIEEGHVAHDDIPHAKSGTRTSGYIDWVQQAAESNEPYRVVIAPDDWHTARSGIRRAVTSLDLDEDIDVISRHLRDGNYAVFITPKNAKNQPPQKGRK